MEPHSGMWLRVEGTITEVRDFGIGKIVEVTANDGLAISCRFAGSDLDEHLIVLRPDDNFAAIGKLWLATPYGISIEECELA